MTLWERLEKMSKDNDLGTTFFVNPGLGNVIVSARTISSDWIVWDAGTIHWPEAAEYHQIFEPAQFLTASNWEWHLGEYVKDGVPFLVQLQVLYAPFTVDEDEDSIIGWVLMVDVDN